MGRTVEEIKAAITEELRGMLGQPITPPSLETVRRITADQLEQLVPTEEVIFSVEEGGPGKVILKFDPEQIEKLQREGKL